MDGMVKKQMCLRVCCMNKIKKVKTNLGWISWKHPASWSWPGLSQFDSESQDWIKLENWITLSDDHLSLVQAFTLIDQNRDGFIDKEDLKDTYASLGQNGFILLMN